MIWNGDRVKRLAGIIFTKLENWKIEAILFKEQYFDEVEAIKAMHVITCLISSTEINFPMQRIEAREKWFIILKSRNSNNRNK